MERKGRRWAWVAVISALRMLRPKNACKLEASIVRGQLKTKQTKTQASDSKVHIWCLSYEPSILRLQKAATTTKIKETKMKQNPPNSSFSEQFEFLLLPVTAALTGQAEVTRGLWLIAPCLSYFSCCCDEICDKEDLEGKSMVMVEDNVVCVVGKTDGFGGISGKSRVWGRVSASAEIKAAAQVSPSFLVRLNSSLCNGAAPSSLLSLVKSLCKVLVDTPRRGFPRQFPVL